MYKIKYALIEDEYFNRELLKTLITRLDPDFLLVGEAEGVTDGYELLRSTKLDVAFLDIKMPDGNGFDLLKKVEQIDFEVVFVTGFDEYAIKAFDHNALDYVLKPIDLDKLKQTLVKVKNRVQKTIPELNTLNNLIESLNDGNTVISKIPIHYNHKVILLSLNEVQYIYSKEGCTLFFKNSNEKYSSSKQLSDFEFILSGLTNFVRINKGTYINLNFVESYSKGFECIITMKDQSTLEISRRKKSEILEILDARKNNKTA